MSDKSRVLQEREKAGWLTAPFKIPGIDKDSRHKVHLVGAHTDQVSTLAVIPDGSRVVTASDDTAKLWDLKSGTCRKVFEGHTGGVKAVALTPTAGYWSREAAMGP